MPPIGPAEAVAKATKIRGIGLRHEDKIVRDEDNSFVQAYLDGRLEAGQSPCHLPSGGEVHVDPTDVLGVRVP